MKPVGLNNFGEVIDPDYEDLSKKFGLTACLGCLVRTITIEYYSLIYIYYILVIDYVIYE